MDFKKKAIDLAYSDRVRFGIHHAKQIEQALKEVWNEAIEKAAETIYDTKSFVAEDTKADLSDAIRGLKVDKVPDRSEERRKYNRDRGTV